MRKETGFLKQLVVAILVPLFAFTPMYGYAPTGSTPANVGMGQFAAQVGVSWQEYLAKNFPPDISGEDRARIYGLLFGIEDASRRAYHLATAGGLTADEAARRVGPEVQDALTELVAIGTILDGVDSQEDERLSQESQQTTTANTDKQEQQTATQELQKEIADLKERIAKLEEEMLGARGLKWQLKETKVRLKRATTPEDKEFLETEKKRLERELKAGERELKELHKAVKQNKGDPEEQRARIGALETLIGGNPAYHFSESLVEIVGFRQELEGKEKALAELSPASGLTPELQTAKTPTDELARIVTLPENDVRELSLASTLPQDKKLVENFRAKLKQNYERKKRDLKNNKKAMEGEKKTLQKQLRELLRKEGPEAIEKRGAEMDCRIFQIEKALAIYPIKEKALERAYDNFEAKLNFFANWPAKYTETKAKLANKTIFDEKFMDYPLIGSRDLGYGDQGDDIGPGMKDEKEVREMLERAFGYFPEEIKDPKVVAYFQSMGRIMGQSSDLKVPLRIHVLKTPEVNAFAIRGGAIYFFAGLLVADKLMEEHYKKKGLERKPPPITEAMLWGITGHEIAHITLRHTHRMMKPVTIAQILMMAAQVAIMMGTFGFGLLAYLLYYYGMPFLSLALSLKLLGVSREHETEADIVGAQYAHKAGFDPRGNIDWHEWLAKYVGYVLGAGFFYTHPPAYERIWNLERMLAILPPIEGGGRLDSTEFSEIREIIWDILRDKEFQDKVEAADRPTLRAKEIAIQKHRDERCKPYVEDQKHFDPFDETLFRTPFALPRKFSLIVACPADAH